jgi:Fe-S-cluster-containing hydrogenase component 2
MNFKHLIVVLILLSLLYILCARISQTPFVERTKCVGCGDCTRICPTGAITLVDGRAVINTELCINCKFCVKTCTYKAVRVPQ